MTYFSKNCDRFMGPVLSERTAEAAIVLSFSAVVVFAGDVTPCRVKSWTSLNVPK